MRNPSNLKHVTQYVLCDSFLELREELRMETRDGVTSFGFQVSTRGYIESLAWKTRRQVVTGFARPTSQTVNLAAISGEKSA